MKRLQPQFVQIKKPSAWEKDLLVSSLPLKNLDDDNRVKASASGCLIDYAGARLLLSVSHATLNAGRWVAEIRCEEENGTAVFPLDDLHFLMRINSENLGAFLETGAWVPENAVDFCYQVVPSSVEWIHDQVSQDGTSLWQAPRHIFKPTFEETPAKGRRYGFSGHTQVEQLPNLHRPEMPLLCSTLMVCDNLSYIQSDGDIHYFRLPGQHPGKKYFRGCSGAPIINDIGEIIALVMGGVEELDIIAGVSLRYYRRALELAASPISS